MKKLSLEYIAGLVDGEGCFLIHRRKLTGYHRVRIIISNTFPAPLRMIRKEYGGSIGIQKKCKRHLGKKDVFRYRICGRKAILMTKLLLPFLIIKKKQAKLFIKFPFMGSGRKTSISIKKGRESLLNKIRVLNSGG